MANKATVDSFQSSFRPGPGTGMALVTPLDEMCQEECGTVDSPGHLGWVFDIVNPIAAS